MSEQDFRVPSAGPMPVPTPEHQRKISRNKWFEVTTVVLMIAVGFGYLTWRNSGSLAANDPARSLAGSATTVERDGGAPSGTSTVMGRQVLSFSQKDGVFDRHVSLIGAGPDSPLETAVIWLTPVAGEWSASDADMLRAVNRVGELGHKLVWTTGDAMEKAVNTMTAIGGAARPYRKGVAATSDGWKVTYVTYGDADAKADPPQVALYYVLQRLSAGEDPSLAEFNRILYEAIHAGTDAVASLPRPDAPAH